MIIYEKLINVHYFSFRITQKLYEWEMKMCINNILVSWVIQYGIPLGYLKVREYKIVIYYYTLSCACPQFARGNQCPSENLLTNNKDLSILFIFCLNEIIINFFFHNPFLSLLHCPTIVLICCVFIISPFLDSFSSLHNNQIYIFIYFFLLINPPPYL